MFNRILVICTGNICRSPMGEALLAQTLGEGFTVESAGIGALVGHGADPTALELMSERGVDISAHRARQLDLAMVRDFELLLVMDQTHADWIHDRFPIARGRVHRFGHWRDLEVPDPYRRGRAAFEEALRLIEQGVEDWRARLAPHSKA